MSALKPKFSWCGRGYFEIDFVSLLLSTRPHVDRKPAKDAEAAATDAPFPAPSK
jgi:hypothetical protein